MEQGRIHSVDLVNMAIDAARDLGYRIREDGPGGFAAGVCQLKGQKLLFVDPLLSARDRLGLVLEALAFDPAIASVDLPAPLAAALNVVQKGWAGPRAG